MPRIPAGVSDRSVGPFRSAQILTTETSRENRSRALVVAASIVVHALLIAVFLALPARIFPEPDRPERIDIVFYPTSELNPLSVEPLELPEPRQQPPEIVEELDVAEPLVEQPPPLAEPTPPADAARRPPRRPPRPRPEVASTSPTPTAPARPKVRTDLFERTPSAPSAKKTPRRETRTGTFAATDATVRQASDSSRTKNARVGEFEVASAATRSESGRTRVVEGTAFDDTGDAADSRETRTKDHRSVTSTAFNGAATDSVPRSDTRDRGSITNTNFNGAAPGAPAPARGTNHGSVKQGQFADGVAVAQTRRPRARPQENPDTPVEIVSKPKPNYTDEARRLQVEGEVVLEVIFVATGQLRVLRVLQTLGHGLDEAAVEAARKIHFKPARRNGRPIDHAATLRIVFKLA